MTFNSVPATYGRHSLQDSHVKAFVAHGESLEFEEFENVRKDLLTQATALYGLVHEHPIGTMQAHPFNRPDTAVFVATRKRQGPPVVLELHFPNGLGMRLEEKDFVGKTIDLFMDWKDPKTFASKTLNMVLNWDLDHQQLDTRMHWREGFAFASALLERAISSMHLDEPLDVGKSWNEVLVQTLINESQSEHKDAHWRDWLQRWGTPEMMQSFDTLNALFDVSSQYDDWKAHLLHSWTSSKAPAAMAPLPTNLVDEFSP